MASDKFSSRHIQLLFDVKAQTVRNWANEFQDFLSPGARPEVGQHRMFNEDDLAVLALIHEMKENQHATYERIHAALKAGQRGNPPTLPADQVDLLLATEQGQMLAGQIQRLQAEIVELSEERDSLLIHKEQTIRLEQQVADRDNRIQELSAQLERSQAKIESLIGELGYYRETERRKSQ